VFSRCNVVSAVKTPKSFGNEPATKICQVSTPPRQHEITQDHTRGVSIANNFEGLEPCQIRNLFGEGRRNGREGQLSKYKEKKFTAEQGA
jgi:hypothetical protein